MGILSREKQQLHSEKGVGVFSRVSLFSGDYGALLSSALFYVVGNIFQGYNLDTMKLPSAFCKQPC